MSSRDALCPNGDMIGSSFSRCYLSWNQLLLVSMMLGMDVCTWRDGGLPLLLAFRKKRINRCRLLVVVAVGGGVGDGNIGSVILGHECLRAFFVEFEADRIFDCPIKTFTGGSEVPPLSGT